MRTLIDISAETLSRDRVNTIYKYESTRMSIIIFNYINYKFDIAG